MKRPRAIALIDGVFESVPSVWHKEILDALSEGVAVFGASSMGALRAAELDVFGMIGVGRVYGWLKDGTIEDDAEVALLHGPAETSFRAMTVPHVNVRYAAESAVLAKVLSRSTAAQLQRRSEATFYKHRTWPRLLNALPPETTSTFREWMRSTEIDIKKLDAIACVRAAAELASTAAPRICVELPIPSALIRRARRESQGPARVEAASERSVLAEWARSLGARVSRTAIDRQMKVLPKAAGLSESAARLAAERELLAEWAFANASRLVPDLGEGS